MRGLGSSNLQGAQLVAYVEGNQDGTFATFVSNATEALHDATIVGLAIKSITVDMLATSSGFQDLDEVWSDLGFDVAITSSDSVLSAQIGSLRSRPRGLVSVPVTSGTRAALAPLLSRILAGDFRVVISGASEVRPGDVGAADVRVAIVFTAFAPAP
jgi:hypothetical protein